MSSLPEEMRNTISRSVVNATGTMIKAVGGHPADLPMVMLEALIISAQVNCRPTMQRQAFVQMREIADYAFKGAIAEFDRRVAEKVAQNEKDAGNETEKQK